MASTANFDLTYNKLDVVAGGALSNATSTPVSGGSGGSGVTQIVAGTNVTISPSGGTGVVTVNSTAGGGGTGTVTSVASGTGLTGGPITTSGTLSIASTGVSAASYGTASSVPTIAVNAQGQITSASNTSIAISGGAVSGNIAGNAANVTGTVAIGNGGTGATTAATARTNLGAGTVTSVATSGSVNGITLTGGPITTSGTVTLGGTLGSIANSQLSNSAITINTSTGLSGGGTVSLGGSLTLTNTVSGLPSGATTSQSLLYNTSTAAWYTEHFNVQSFGATGNGSTDDTTNINLAIAALNAAGGGELYFPKGTYKIGSSTTTSLTIITVPCHVRGDGVNLSIIKQYDTTHNVLTIQTPYQCIVEHLQLTTNTSTSGNGLDLSYPSGGYRAAFNSNSVIFNVQTSGTMAIGLNLNIYDTTISNCTIGTATVGISVQNPSWPDVSAGMIKECTINTNGHTAIFLGSDGMTVVDNYFYNNNYCINITVDSTSQGSLSDYWIMYNHMEYVLTSAILLVNNTASDYLLNVLINNNEMAWSPPAAATSTMSLVTQSGSSTTAGWLSDFTFVGNVTNTLYDGIHLPYAQRGSITGNTFQYSLNQCVYLGAGTNNIVTKANVFHDTTTPYMDYGSSNSTDYWVAKGVNVTQQNSGGTGLSIPNNSETTVSWNRSIYNDGSFWSSSSPTLITVPYNVGIKRVQLTASINWDPNATGYRQIKIKDNNGNTYGGNLIPGATTADFSSDYNSTLTCMIDLASMSNPTSFYVTATQDSGGALNIRSSYGSFFCMEIKC